jgi:sulfite dehydrogenase (quinone) subunit SoeA
MGIEDDSWVWVESHNGKIRVQVKLMEGCEEHTVWTWNAIGKQKRRLGPEGRLRVDRASCSTT